MAADNPFPGMNPFLEERWGDVHSSLVTYARDGLQDALPANLRARGQERVFIESHGGPDRSFYPDVFITEYPGARVESGGGAMATLDAVAEPIVWEVPDIEITEPFIEIIDAGSGGQVVTSIEFLSRSNKRPGPGRELYLQKQTDCQRGGVNLVEIDLLRGGARTTLAQPHILKSGRVEPYHASAWRAARPLRFEGYLMRMADRLPAIRIPLRKGDADVALDLQVLVDLAFRRGRHDDIDYREALDPPLSAEERAWVEAVLKSPRPA